MHSPETPLDCCSLAGLNRASLSDLALVWSVIVGQEGEVEKGGLAVQRNDVSKGSPLCAA
jgi:hypothetical protein